MWKISSHTPGLHAGSWIFLLSSRWNVNVMPLCWKVDTRNILQHYVTIMLYAAATLLQQCINCSITPHDTAVVNRDGAMPLPMVASFTISTAEEPAPVCKLSVSLWSKVNKVINKVCSFKNIWNPRLQHNAALQSQIIKKYVNAAVKRFMYLELKTNKGRCAKHNKGLALRILYDILFKTF